MHQLAGHATQYPFTQAAVPPGACHHQVGALLQGQCVELARHDVLELAVPALVVAMRDEGTGREARGPGAPINDLPPDIRGGFQRDLPAGTWRVRVDSEGFLSRELQVALSAGVVHRQAVSLRRRPQSPAPAGRCSGKGCCRR